LLGGIRSWPFVAAGIALPLAIFGLFSTSQLRQSSDHFAVKYHSEGILGQLRVVDQQYYTLTRGWMPGRSLMVNNTVQTIVDLKNPAYSLWDWAYYLPLAASIYPRGSEALLLGLGGGTLVKQFQRLGFSVEAGFDTQLFVTPGEEGGRNLIFLASIEPKDFSTASYSEPGLPEVPDMTRMLLDPSKLDLSDSVVLSDGRPALEKYYIEAAVAWRESATESVTVRMLGEGIAPFR
jgi:hypothetical protein